MLVLAPGCCNWGRPGPGEAVTVPDSGRIERHQPARRYGQIVQRPDAPSADLVARLRAASTVNVDALGLAPVAAEAMPMGSEDLPGGAEGGEGVLIAASEPGAWFRVGGGPAERVPPGTAARGWHRALRVLPPGAHAVRVGKDGFLPVDVQVLVRPGVVEVVAARLGRERSP